VREKIAGRLKDERGEPEEAGTEIQTRYSLEKKRCEV